MVLGYAQNVEVGLSSNLILNKQYVSNFLFLLPKSGTVLGPTFENSKKADPTPLLYQDLCPALGRRFVDLFDRQYLPEVADGEDRDFLFLDAIDEPELPMTISRRSFRLTSGTPRPLSGKRERFFALAKMPSAQHRAASGLSWAM